MKIKQGCMCPELTEVNDSAKSVASAAATEQREEREDVRDPPTTVREAPDANMR